jgi:hypothetical protein
MTRVLSELLGVQPLTFRAGLDQLERASGHGSTDIRLTTEIMHAAQHKLKQLGLDPHDTTGPELYKVLEARIKEDDRRLIALLRKRHGSQQPADDVSHVAKELDKLPVANSAFAMKSAVSKRLLKKLPPKHAMKALGYRSLDSLLKHEQPAAIYAAAWLVESANWRQHFIDQYKKLRVSDFEIRQIAILSPNTAKWQKLANSQVAIRKHNVLGFRELGAVVLLPLPEERPPAAVTTSLLLALHEMNEVRAASTFLKLCQVRSDFGACLMQVAQGDASLSAELFGRAVPWQVIQRYYARFADRFRAEIFEPHVQAEDLSWHSVEKVMSYIDPRLEFWNHTTHLSLLHDKQPVSMNIIDVALNYCNQLPFERRIVRYLRHNLWHELIIRYLKHENVEQLVVGGLESELVTVPEIA